MVSAVGQGALGIEVRHEDSALRAFLREISDPASTLEVEAERAFLNALGGGCQVPIGALARMRGDELHLTACICSLDGSAVYRTQRTGKVVAAAELGRQTAHELLEQGADAIIASIR